MAAPDPIDGDEEGVTSVGAASIAEALLAMRRPPASDIREICPSRGDDPYDSEPDGSLTYFVDSLDVPAVEAKPAPARVRRETVKMAPPPRQGTLPMIDRPQLPPPVVASPSPSPSPSPVLVLAPPPADAGSWAFLFPLLVGIALGALVVVLLR